MDRLARLVCVKDFEVAALKLLDYHSAQYYSSAADDEITLMENKKAFNRLLLRPRLLRDVSKRSTSWNVLGRSVAFPLGISPTAMQKLAHPDGECATAKAAELMGTVYIMSTMSTCTVEQVAEAAPKGRKWFQQYLYNDRNIQLDHLRRAESSGFEAVVITVDAPLVGRRRVNIRDGFRLPPHLDLVHFKSQRSALSFHNELVSCSATWEDVKWMCTATKLPVIVKGVLTPEDAELAVQAGVAGVFVSNHGARQLDTLSPTIDALPAIVKSVKGRCEIYLDGGVSTGGDVFKGLALGATMVFAGRPIIWGLSVAGEDGAKKVLEIFRDEFDLTMALMGVASVKEIQPVYVGRSPGADL